jgi:hypothetical protein
MVPKVRYLCCMFSVLTQNLVFAERARSISPEKSTTPQSFRSPHDTPKSTHGSITASPIDTMEPLLKSSTPQTRDEALQRLTSGAPTHADADETKHNPSPLAFSKPSDESTIGIPEPTKPSPSPSALSRSGTLSWQQRRPQSGSIRRPLSMVATENAARSPSPRATPDQTPSKEKNDDTGLSRDQIAQSLGSKDPSWFRQTPDRGIGSAAYRKSQEESVENPRWSQNSSKAHEVVGSLRRQLPGMSRESTAESDDVSSPPSDGIRSASPSHASSARGSASSWGNRFSSNTSVSDASTLDGKSPLPTSERQKFAPPTEHSPNTNTSERSNGRGLAMSPSQGRISPERMDRPVSPTKGMGGFVQSAMLKRENSVNKRWSATPAGSTPGLSRNASTASNRSAHGGIGNTTSISKMDHRPSSLSRDNSLEPSSRPTSSHGNTAIPQDTNKAADGFAKPALPHHARAKSVTSPIKFNRPEENGAEPSPPPSPSKRWSPTKSSWLENAINRPESPTKPKFQVTPQQPAWMAEITKAKQQRMGGEVAKDKSAKESTITTSSNSSANVEPAQKDSFPSKENAANLNEPDITKEKVIPEPKIKPAVLSPELDRTSDVSPKPSPEKTLKSSASVQSSTNDDTPSAKPSKPITPPKKDFRSNLKARQPPSDSSKNEALEFQNVFGKLKKAETKNYVAPDTFKENITRGKAALNVTGGPKPREKRDELKESLLKRKEEMKAKVAESGSVAGKKADKPDQPIAEALAFRQRLGRQGSDSNTLSPPKTLSSESSDSKPEAVTHQQSLRDRSQSPSVAAVTVESSASTMSQTKASNISSKLADRFNPALAGLLARGPSPLTGGSQPPKRLDDPAGSLESISDGNLTTSSKEKTLTHMTKGRTKGPKRRAPTAKPTPANETDDTSNAKVSPGQNVSKSHTPASRRIPSVSLVKQKDILSSNVQDSAQPTSADSPTYSQPLTPKKAGDKAKPAAPMKSPDLVMRVEEPARSLVTERGTKDTPSKPTAPAKTPELLKKSKDLNQMESTMQQEVTQIKPRVVSPKPASLNRFSRGDRSVESGSPLSSTATTIAPNASPKEEDFRIRSRPDSPAKDSPQDDVSNVSVKNAAALWGQPSSATSASSGRKSPIKLPTRKDEQEAHENAGLSRSEQSSTVGLGLNTVSPTNSSQPSVLLATKTSYSKPPLSPPTSTETTPRPPPRVFEDESKPSSTLSDSAKVFGDRFDSPPDTTGDLMKNIDTQKILSASPIDNDKIQTLRNQIWELASDGNMSHIPIQEEHILYDESMYLSVHLFQTGNGSKKTEVYLWIGNEISDLTLEEAQVHARTTAKENRANLSIIRQGKETPRFFTALGGILITRRGTRNTPKDYMLCGRRHLGHLAFDETDLALKSLCSGFVFVLCLEGRLFLWKGSGSSQEEISAARLISMDLVSMGELVELEDGKETPLFLDLFPAPEKGPKSIPRSAEHWRYKASTDRYHTRLFRVRQQTAEQAQLEKQHQQGGLQVSGFWPMSLRRPSWASFAEKRSSSPTLGSPQTPTKQDIVDKRSSSPLRPSSVASSVKSKDDVDKDEIITTVQEIAPFRQQDLEAGGVYVLDAFFEMYM